MIIFFYCASDKRAVFDHARLLSHTLIAIGAKTGKRK
jgi:hypothetical protein